MNQFQHLSNFNPRNRDARGDMKIEMKNRERRALAAYWRTPESNHPPDTVTHFECDELEYVQLSAEVAGVLAVYRVRNDGQLKRLRRLPDFASSRVFTVD